MTKRKPPSQHKRRGRKPAKDGARIRLELRRLEALKLRQAGHTYRQIGQWLDPPCKTTRAFDLVAEALLHVAAETAETAETVRAIELLRLDDMMIAPYAAAKAGDLRAVDAVLKIMDRRARLLGLDAAAKHEHHGPEGGVVQFARIERVIIDHSVESIVYLPEQEHLNSGLLS